MAICVQTFDPRGLLAAIKEDIDRKAIDSWEYNGEGDLTHTPSQWYGKAWLRPKIALGVLEFSLIKQNDPTSGGVIYGVYHSRFIEMLLTHFNTEFANAAVTALPISGLDLMN